METGSSRRKLLQYIPIAIIAAGIILRLIVYLQNRDLWTDEVAVALNIFERSFSELTTPLSYNQYAPPVFLWLVKLSTTILGYGEQAFRLVPLLSGIGALLLLYKILDKSIEGSAKWYPLALFATGIYYLRYATELKQYMPDAFVALFLVWLALRTTLKSNIKLALIWTLVGSITIWASMPSVFILAAIGCYYGATIISNKEYKKLWVIVIPAILWLGQFLVYYYAILSQQISSDFLVGYHERYFLHKLPAGQAEWTHNKDLLNTILSKTFSNNWWSYWFNLALLITGIVSAIRVRNSKAILFIMPVVLMILAAAMKQYSLIPRLTLFAMPLLLVIAGYGLHHLVKTKRVFVKELTTVLSITAFLYSQPLLAIRKPIKEECITESLDYLADKNIEGKQLIVYTGAINAYNYYTKVHPDQTKWIGLKEGILLEQGADVTQLIPGTDTVALLYTIAFDSYYVKDKLAEQMQSAGSYETDGSSAYIFTR